MLSRKKPRELLVMVIAALFVVAFASVAFAFSAGDTPFTYTGKIVAVDNANKILTVQAGPNDQLVFRLNDNGAIMKCGKPVAWSDLRSGDSVTLSYFEKSSGNYIADTITLAPSMMEHCS